MGVYKCYFYRPGLYRFYIQYSILLEQFTFTMHHMIQLHQICEKKPTVFCFKFIPANVLICGVGC